MTFTSPTEDIIVQEGTFAFDYDCSGAVSAGQGVYANATGLYVAAAPEERGNVDVTAGCLGVAAYGQTHGNPVAVYGPGNIVRVIISGTSKCTVAKPVYCVSEGKFANIANYACPSGVYGIALETQGTANGTAKVLLVD